MKYRLEEFTTDDEVRAYLNSSLDDPYLHEQKCLLSESGYSKTGKVFRVTDIRDNIIPALPEVYEEIMEESEQYILAVMHTANSLPAYRIYEKTNREEKLVFNSYLFSAASNIFRKLSASGHLKQKKVAILL